MTIYNLAFKENQCIHFGLSSDVKPAENDGHVFIESNTGKIFNRESGVWVEKTNPSYALAGQGGGQAFPVGSVFIAVVSTNPATLLGYGTWSAFAAGRVLVGLNSSDTDFDTVEETGGAKTHTLTTAEMPSHTHFQDSHFHTQRRNATSTGSNTGWTTAFDTSSSNPSADSNTGTGSTTAVNQNTGGGGAHNNLQPFVIVHIWKRTA